MSRCEGMHLKFLENTAQPFCLLQKALNNSIPKVFLQWKIHLGFDNKGAVRDCFLNLLEG